MKGKRTQQRHAIRRARERHGLVVSENDLEELSHRIRHGHGLDPGVKFLKRQTHRVSAYRVTLHGIVCDVLYDKNTHTVITFLSGESGDAY